MIPTISSTATQTFSGTSSTQNSTSASSNLAAAACTSSARSTLGSSTCVANHDAAVGAGVIIPLLIAIMTFLVLWLRERRTRKKENKERVGLAPQGYSDAKYTYTGAQFGVHSPLASTSTGPSELNHESRRTELQG